MVQKRKSHVISLELRSSRQRHCKYVNIREPTYQFRDGSNLSILEQCEIYGEKQCEILLFEVK